MADPIITRMLWLNFLPPLLLLLVVVLVSELDDELEEDGDVDDPDDEVEEEAGGEVVVVDELVLESAFATLKIFASGEFGGKFSIAARKSLKEIKQEI